jgi:Leucine-rich repeat (LRR) protein
MYVHALSDGEVASLNALASVWGDRLGWTGKPSCKWRGIDCTLLGHVRTIDVGIKGLQGSIPSAIGGFPWLVNLRLAVNHFEGPLPRSVCQLTELVFMDVSNNLVNGSFPDCIGALAKLERISFDNCRLGGALPPSVANLTSMISFRIGGGGMSFVGSTAPLAGMRNVQQLILSGNDFTSLAPELGALKHLVQLDAGSMRLTGSIPDSFGLLGSLESLDLSGNSLSGPIPSSFANLTSIVDIDLNENRLSGQLPDLSPALDTLHTLFLDSNRFTGTLPEWFCQVPVASAVFDNTFTCPLPSCCKERTDCGHCI